MDFARIAETLETFGAWGLCAILLIFSGVLLRTIWKLLQQRDTDARDLNEKFFRMMEKRVSVDIEQKEALRQLREVIKSELVPTLRGKN
jgi:hypothetical protein